MLQQARLDYLKALATYLKELSYVLEELGCYEESLSLLERAEKMGEEIKNTASGGIDNAPKGSGRMTHKTQNSILNCGSNRMDTSLG